MKWKAGIGFVVLGLAVALWARVRAGLPSQTAHLTVQEEKLASHVPRIGLNLGSWTSWGAEQLSSNVLKNPGLEGIVDGAIVSVREATGTGFTDDTDWLARPHGFWNGARFEVKSGAMAGASGNVKRYSVSPADKLGYFETGSDLPELALGDIIAVQKTDDTGLPAQWWYDPASGEGFHPDASAKRPGSSGARSLRITAKAGQTVAVSSYLDTIGNRAGTLLPLKGEWELSYWAKSSGNSIIRGLVGRVGREPYLNRPQRLTGEWREYRYQFKASEGGLAANLQLRFEVEDGTVWLDDVSLHSVLSPGSSAFRGEVVEDLKELHPGYLRDWQGQLGDTLQNRLADSFGRRSYRYRPGPDQTDYGYGLGDFVDLCAEIGARPWIVLPTTMSGEDWTSAGQRIEAMAARHGFGEVLIEFGNENWNPLFRPAGILDPEHFGEAANRAFELFRKGTGGDRRFRFVLSGQFANPEPLGRAASAAPAANLLAAAPYWGYALTGKSPAAVDLLPSLFPHYEEQFHNFAALAAKSGKQPAIYEMNAHSLDSKADADSVNTVIAGQASAAALASTSLEAYLAGIERQCVYSFSGFDVLRPDGSPIRLFGITRDLAGPGHFRPSGLALALMNRAVGGDPHKVTPANNDGLVAAAFFSDGQWRFAIASRRPSTADVWLHFPSSPRGKLPEQLLVLSGSGPLVTNEDGQNTRVNAAAAFSAPEDGQLHFQLPGYAVAVGIAGGKAGS